MVVPLPSLATPHGAICRATLRDSGAAAYETSTDPGASEGHGCSRGASGDGGCLIRHVPVAGAYSPDGGTLSQSECYLRVTAVTDRLQCVVEAFQALEGAGGQQFGQGPAVGQAQGGGRHFGERIKHEGPGVQVVVRDCQAWFGEYPVAE